MRDERYYTIQGFLDETLEEIYSEELIETYFFEQDEDQVWYDLLRVDFPKLNQSARQGTYYVKVDGEEEWVPDFGQTQVYDIKDTKSENYQYFENDGLATTLHNYLRATGYDVDNLNELGIPCEICIEDYEENDT